jgi:hypothetical protein
MQTVSDNIIQVNPQAIHKLADVHHALRAKYGTLSEAAVRLQLNYVTTRGILNRQIKALNHPGIVDAIMTDLGLTNPAVFEN